MHAYIVVGVCIYTFFIFTVCNTMVLHYIYDSEVSKNAKMSQIIIMIFIIRCHMRQFACAMFFTLVIKFLLITLIIS